MSYFKSPSSTFLNYALLFGVGFLWGFQYLLNHLAFESFSIWMIPAGRIFIGAIFLTLLLIPKIGKTYSPQSLRSFWSFLPEFIIIGFFETTLPWSLIIWAQQQLSSSFTAILIGTVPLFVTLLEVFFIKDHSITREKTIALVIGLFGVLFLVSQKIFAPNIIDAFSRSLPGLPILAMLVAAVSFSISVLLIKIRLGTNLSPLQSAQGIFVGGLLTALPFFLWMSQPWTLSSFHCTQTALLALILLGALCGGTVYILYVTLIVKTSPSFASTANYIAMTVAVFIGIILQGGKLPFSMLGGCLLILIALWLFNEKQPQK